MVTSRPLSERAASRQEAVRFRAQGMSYIDIGARLNVNEQTARQWVCRQLKGNPAEGVAEMRAVEGAGLDALEAEAWARLNADPKPNDNNFARLATTVLHIKLRRAALMGLDKPVVVEHKIDVRRDHDATLEVLVSELTGGGVIQSGPDDMLIDGEVVDDSGGA